MTWENRLRLFVGVVAVLALGLGLSMVFNHRQNQVSSFTAQVAADTYTVGADHPGTVIKQDVKVDDQVTKGQELFQVQSLQLKEAIASGLEVGDTEAYKIDSARGVITYYAVTSGRIDSLNAIQGNSVPSSGSLATLSGDSRFVTASFRLVPRDYARVVDGATARVTLPNDQVITATVSNVSVASSVDGTIATLKLEAPALATLTQQTLSEPGTPVSVTVELVDAGPLAPLTDSMNDFLQQVGLR